MKHYITDMGRTLEATDVKTGARQRVPRFAVWGRRNFDGKPVVLEVSESVDELLTTYGSEVPVYRLDELEPLKP